MAKMIKVEIISRAKAKRISQIVGESSAAAAALRALDKMGDDAANFEICRDQRGALLLIWKEFLNVEATSLPPDFSTVKAC